ncbi:MAG: glycosyltransferase family 39 protein, partial [Pyrinomonadaceae bacterium]
MTGKRPLEMIAMASLIALYVAVRMWHLTDSCLWFDEIFSVHAAEQPWGQILNFVAADLVHPPLFYLILKGWVGIGGSGLLWLRLLPVLFASLAIIPFLLLSRELKLRVSTTVLALLLLGVNGALIKYAQGVRMYTMLMCVSLVSIWLFTRYLNRDKGWVWLLLTNVVLVYTHYYGFFVVGAEVIYVLAFYRQRAKPLIGMAAIVGALFSPWAIAVISAARRGSEIAQNISWIERPGPSQLWVFLIDLIEPFYYPGNNLDANSIYTVSLPLLLVIFIAGILFIFGKRANDQQEHKTTLVATFLVVPIVLAFALSWIMPQSIWGTRHLIVVMAPAALLVSILLTETYHKFSAAAVTTVILLSGYAFFLVASAPDRSYIWCSWETMATDIKPFESAPPRPLRLYASENLVAYHVWFATRNIPDVEV